MLSHRFTDATVYAIEAHATQSRKGARATGVLPVPYVAHLMGVAALVLEDHGSEHEAIAALLHDTVEDQGGQARLDDIRSRYGETVAEIVAGCSDVIPTELEQRKPPWGPRKASYVQHLRGVSGELGRSILRVSLADKVHNLGVTVREARGGDIRFWLAFTNGAGGQLGYYRALAAVYREHGIAGPLLLEFETLISSLEQLVGDDELATAAQIEHRLLTGWSA